MAETSNPFEEQEKRRQATFRRTSETISSKWTAPFDKDRPQLRHWLALGSEDENLYPSLRGANGVRRFFDERAICWWRQPEFDTAGENGPTMNMASSQIACVNFVLPLAEIENGLLAMLAAIDDDVTGIVDIEDTERQTKSPIEFEWIGLKHAIEGPEVTTRGACSTSVDAFLIAETRSGLRGYLLEWKYTESNDKGKNGGRTLSTHSESSMRILRRFAPESRWMPGSMNRSTN